MLRRSNEPQDLKGNKSLLAGQLYKLGDYVKNWRLRLFVVYGKPVPSLAYYRDPNRQSRPTQILFLKGATVEVVDLSGDKELHRFNVTDVSGNTYRLAASSTAARQSWLSTINQAIALARSQNGTPNRSPASPTSGLVCSTPTGRALSAQSSVGPESRLTVDLQPPTPGSVTSVFDQGSDVDSFASIANSAAPSPSIGGGARRLSLKTQCKEWVRETFKAPPGSPKAEAAIEFPGSSLPLTESVKPLTLKSPLEVLLDRSQPDLPQESLLEHFERAQQFVARRQPFLKSETLRTLEGWQAMAEAHPSSERPTPQHLSAAAMFVMELTRTQPDWAAWKETDTSAVSPENMLEQLRVSPTARVLEDLGNCLAYRSTTWLLMYCRLGGVAMQLEALNVHIEAAAPGNHEDAHVAPIHDSPEAVLAALQSLYTLKSTAAGVQAILQEEGALSKMCRALEIGSPEASKLVLDMLLHILIFSSFGYCTVIQTLMGETAKPVEKAASTSAGPDESAYKLPNLQPEAGKDEKGAPEGRRESPTSPPPPLPPAKAKSQPPAPPPPPPPPKVKGGGGATPAPPAPPPPPPRAKDKKIGPSAPSPPPPPPPPPAASKLSPRLSGGRASPPAPPPPPPPPPPASKLSPRLSGGRASPPAPPPPPPPPPAASKLSPRLSGGRASPPAPPPPTSPKEPPPSAPQLPAAQPKSANAAKADALKTKKVALSAATNFPDSNGEIQQPEQCLRSDSQDAAVLAEEAGRDGNAGSHVVADSKAKAQHNKSRSGDPSLEQKATDSVVQMEAAGRLPSQANHLESVFGAVESPERRNHRHDGVPAREYCSVLLEMLKGDVDFDVATKLLTLIAAAMDAYDAASYPELRLGFVKMLLDKGLLMAVADVNSYGVEHICALASSLLSRVRQVMSPPKAPTNSPSKPVKPAPKSVAAPPPPPAPPGPKRAPPPPPGRKPVGASAAKAKPAPKPSVKLKGFFWEKVPDIRIPGTFWSSHPPKYELLRQEQVEHLFQAKQPAAVGAGGKAQKKKKMNLLDVKRATAIGVQARSLKCHWSVVKEAIADFNPRVFETEDDVVSVLKCLPSEEEQELLRSFIAGGGNLSVLTDEELFSIELMKVPRARSRLMTFKIKFEAQTQLHEAAAALENHIKAQAELKASRCFAAILDEALAHGNFFNHGNARLGQAAGFRLQTLTKLQDTRSTDGKTTLMAYFADKLMHAMPPQQPLLSELPHALLLSTTLAEVKEMIERVVQSISLVKLELEALPPPVTVSLDVAEGAVKLSVNIDDYQLQMAEVIKAFQVGVERVRAQQERAEKGFAALVAFYGENPNSIPSDANFWRPIAAFVQSFTAAQNAIMAKQKEQAEKERRQQKAAQTNATNSESFWKQKGSEDADASQPPAAPKQAAAARAARRPTIEGSPGPQRVRPPRS